MSKRTLTILIVINLLLIPCVFLPLLGMARRELRKTLAVSHGFHTGFHVTNATQHPITITPIGAIGTEGDRIPLVSLHRFTPTGPEVQPNFQVAPSETVNLTYDWDDIQFSEIIIKDHNGNLSQLIVDPNPYENQYHPPETDTFVIDAQTILTPVAPDIMDAYNIAQNDPNPLPTILIAILPWITLPLLIRLRIKSGKHSASNTPSPTTPAM